MKSKRILALLVALAMCLPMVLASCDKLGKKDIEADPVGRIIQSADETAESIVNSLSPLDPIRAAGKKGSIGLNLAPDGADAKLAVTYAYDTEAKKASADVSLGAGDETVDADISFDDKNLAISAPALWEGAYGVDYTTFAEDLKNSELLELMGVSYEDIEAQIQPVLDAIKNRVELDTTAFSDAAGKLGDDLKARLNKCVSGIEKKDVTVAGEEVKAFEITFKLAKNDIADILAIIRDDGKSVYDEYMKLMEKMIVANDESVSVSDMFDYSEFAETIDEAIEELNEEGNDATADVTAYLDPKTTDFMALKYVLTATDGENEYTGRIEGGIELGSDKKLTGTLKATEKPADEDEVVIDDIKFTAECIDDEKTFSVKTAINTKSGENSSDVVIDFNNDKAAKTYTASINTTDSFDGEDSIVCKYEVSGKMEYDATNLTFSVDKVAATEDGEDNSVEGIGLTVRISADAGDINVPEYRNVLKMTSAEYMDFVVEVREKAQSAAPVIQSFSEGVAEIIPGIGDPGMSFTPDYPDIGGPGVAEGEKSYFDICENFDETFDYNYDGVLDESDRKEWLAEFKPFGSVFDETFDYDSDGEVGTEADRDGYEMMVSMFKDMPVNDLMGGDMDDDFTSDDDFISDFDDYYAEFNEDYDYDGDGETGTDADRQEYDTYYKMFADDFDPSVDYDQDGKVDSDDKEWYDFIRMY